MSPAPPPDLPGWRHVYSGKVRDLYEPTDGPRERVLVVASDRISAYDHVLATTIPDKGVVLTALSLWWFTELEPLVVGHVLPDPVPQAVAGRAMVCRTLQMYPVECVARGYLTGSGLREYRTHGTVCGIELPPGLQDGSQLPEPIFTPATKAAVGAHDENISFDQLTQLVGVETAQELRRTTLRIYGDAERTAATRGLILADTKLEFGRDADTGGLVLGDEVLTPDSSRYWDAEQWQPGRAQASFDKQYVRDWLTSPEAGWDQDGGQPPPPLPEQVVDRTRQRYLQAYSRITGTPLAR